jgi:phenylacetate-coenzyme A ligase PaaK-like adenylate-forming protein
LATEEAVLRQMMRGMREVGGFNCLSVPPYTPEGAVQKGFTLDGLLDLDVENYIGANIRTIITAANWLDNPRYALRQRVWEANELAGAPRTIFVDTYGCSEVGTLGFECQEMDGLHLLLGATHTEIIRPDGTHVANGERGRVIVTGLKHGSRYLRYVVGDEATYVSDPCKCGYRTPRLKHIVRVLDKERLRQGCAAG